MCIRISKLDSGQDKPNVQKRKPVLKRQLKPKAGNVAASGGNQKQFLNILFCKKNSMLHKHHFLQKNSMNRDLSQVATTTTVTPRGFKHFKLKAYEKACHIDSQQCARHATCGSGRRCQFLHMVRSRQANCGFSELLCPKFLLCS